MASIAMGDHRHIFHSDSDCDSKLQEGKAPIAMQGIGPTQGRFYIFYLRPILIKKKV